jgi:hypothetical protein
MTPKNFLGPKLKYGYQNEEFNADFESVEKVAKNSCGKSYQQKSDRKMEFLTFITVCKVFASIRTFC